MSSGGRPETRTQILEAARALFEELGYYGAGLEAVAKKAGVSRQAIYLHFPSKAELLTALHLHIFATDVVPALERHPITDAMTALDALDATIAVDVEVASKVWRIHEALSWPDGSTRRSRRPCARARRSATASCSTSGAGSSERARCHRDMRVAHVRGHAVGPHERRHLQEPRHRTRLVARPVQALGAQHDPAPDQRRLTRAQPCQGGATPQPQRGTGACSATPSASGRELCIASRVPHSTYPMIAARNSGSAGQPGVVRGQAHRRGEPVPLLGRDRQVAVVGQHRFVAAELVGVDRRPAEHLGPPGGDVVAVLLGDPAGEERRAAGRRARPGRRTRR